MLGRRQQRRAAVFCRVLSSRHDVTAGSREGRSHGEVKNKIHRAFISLIALSLSGCFADQKQLVVSCEFEAMQTYPREQLATGAHIGDYTQSCMKVHGYGWNMTDKRCQVTTTVERNIFCIPVPRDRNGRNLIQVQDDRFLFNWKKAAEDDRYPSYEQVIERFSHYLAGFLECLKSEDIGVLTACRSCSTASIH